MPVSRETAERLDIFVALLARWLKKTNLIAATTITSVWTRHIADSAQILLASPRAVRWLDMGSGAGFPGIVLAMQLAEVPGAVIHCIESDRRKSAFLREAAAATCSPAIVHSSRVHSVNRAAVGIVDAITARALAPLSDTLDMAEGWLKAGAVGVFPRGNSFGRQLEGLHPKYKIDIVPSVVDHGTALLRISEAS